MIQDYIAAKAFDHRVERVVLGILILEERAQTVSSDLFSGDFTLSTHRTIYSLITDMLADGKKLDPVTIVSQVQRMGAEDSVGGLSYLAHIMEGIPRGSDPQPYISILKEKSALRRILGMFEVAIGQIDAGDAASGILEALTSGITATQMDSLTVRPVPLGTFVLPALDEMRAQRDRTEEVLGISTGIPNLDAATSGWRDGEMTYVGALPGRGKTSFMLQAMFHAASSGTEVGCISLEMRGKQLARRLGIMQSRIHAQRFRDPKLMNLTDWEHTKRSMYQLIELPITMCDQSGLRPGQIASLARQMHAEGAKAIFVDFVQIIHEEGKDRREAINRVSASLRDTCKALEIPFIVASQLARRDADPNRRPTLQDFRESGNLEQDCHNALMLYRPKNKETSEWTGQDEILIEKQREGLTGSVPVVYDESTLRFTGR